MGFILLKLISDINANRHGCIPYTSAGTLIEGEQKKQIALDPIALNVRRTIYRPYRGFNTLELEPIKVALNKMDNFLNKFVKS